ncbi:MAG: hypothetical protein LUD01_00760 [Clostridiales bacterium]|nr:hypothetical protein [Clostridiales bacterium]
MSDYTEKETITIKFGKGLADRHFTSKAGKDLVEVKIPNEDPGDKRPWQSFVVGAGMVHDNKYGKGVWMRLPADGETKVSRPVLTGQDENGKNIWENETRMVPNTELKAMMEAYKTRDRDSVLSDLDSKKPAAEATRSARPSPEKAARPKQAAR